MAEKAARNDPSVVQDQQVSWAQNIGKFTKSSVTKRAGHSIEVQHPGGCAIHQGLLGD